MLMVSKFEVLALSMVSDSTNHWWIIVLTVTKDVYHLTEDSRVIGYSFDEGIWILMGIGYGMGPALSQTFSSCRASIATTGPQALSIRLVEISRP